MSELVFACGLCRSRLFFAWGHRDDNIFALFIAEFGYAQNEFVFVDAKLSHFADREQDRMFVVSGANAIDNVVGLQNIFLAEKLLGLLFCESVPISSPAKVFPSFSCVPHELESMRSRVPF
jgi:hypothetical protein